jgi:mannose-1-phosphate guanylyltransferase
MKPIIICGGIGIKLWPLSRKSLPKQFLKIFNGKSLFQLNWTALRTSFRADEIYIQTNEFQAGLALEQVPEVLPDHIFIEPKTLNQGPATGFCAAKLYKQFPDEAFMLVQADVLRTPTNRFIDFMRYAEKLIMENQLLVTGLVRPKQGIEGIDFMITGQQIPSTHDMNVYRLEKWVMRNSPTRKKIYDCSKIYAHANHYAWTPRLMLKAFEQYAPEWYQPLANMIEAFDTNKEEEVIKREYNRMPPGPIEDRVTNHIMKNGLLVECPFEWLDLGTWDSLESYWREAGIKPSCQVIAVDSADSFVMAQKTVVILGIDGLQVIDSPDALLITRKNSGQQIGKVISILQDHHPELL